MTTRLCHTLLLSSKRVPGKVGNDRDWSRATICFMRTSQGGSIWLAVLIVFGLLVAADGAYYIMQQHQAQQSAQNYPSISTLGGRDQTQSQSANTSAGNQLATGENPTIQSGTAPTSTVASPTSPVETYSTGGLTSTTSKEVPAEVAPASTGTISAASVNNNVAAATPSVNAADDDILRIQGLDALRTILGAYYNTNGKAYPSTLAQLDTFASKNFPGGVPVDPDTKEPYLYEPALNDSSYAGCASLSTKGYACIDSGSGSLMYNFWESGIDEPADQWDTFESQDGDFTFKYPSVWLRGETTPPGTVIFYLLAATSSPATTSQPTQGWALAGVDAYNLSVLLARAGYASSSSLQDIEESMLATYYTNGVAPATDNWTDISFHDDPTYVTNIQVSYALGGFSQRVYLIDHEGTYYILSLLYKTEDQQLFSEVFDNILASFTFAH